MSEIEQPELPPLPLLARAPVSSQEGSELLQKPGLDTHLRRSIVGGPDSAQDIRFMISTTVLRVILEVAQKSITRRAIIHDCRFKISTFVDKGHLFQLLTIIGKLPVPEMPPIVGLIEEPSNEIIKEQMIQPLDTGWSLQTERVIGEDSSLRLFLSTDLLENLLDCATRSRTRRAIIHQAGLVLDVYQTPTGSLYQVVTVMGLRPKPEETAIILAKT